MRKTEIASAAMPAFGRPAAQVIGTLRDDDRARRSDRRRRRGGAGAALADRAVAVGASTIERHALRGGRPILLLPARIRVRVGGQQRERPGERTGRTFCARLRNDER
jgi:hypothetical protein